jgi:serine phosphatase RsbU (regulator of sigma subunit)
LLSRVYCNKPSGKLKEENLLCKAVTVAMKGETFCGDAWYKKVTRDHIKIMLCDGLGHGIHANLAVNEAINAFKLCPHNHPVDILRFMHDMIKKTRGMVATVIVYDIKKKEWRICGVGNISIRLSNAINSKRHTSYNGIVGHNIPNTMNDHVFSDEQIKSFTLCSDGITSKWDLAKYPMIQKYDLAIQAAALYKDFGRKTDDMSVILGKLK